MIDPGPISIETIRTERLLLRPLSESDRKAFRVFEDGSREHFSRWSPGPPGDETPDGLFERQLKRTRDGLERGTALRLIALEHGTGRVAGRFSLNNITRGAAQYADAGWMVGVDCIGRGYATEGVWAILDAAFAPPERGLGLHRVQANVIPDNGPSLRVAAKCGFRVEGLARRLLLVGGAWQDHLTHAKLAEEHRLRYLA